MTPTRKTPSHPIIKTCTIEGGYQLCASCGDELTNGDTASIVDLGAGLRDYVHPKCLKVRIPQRWNKAIRIHDARSGKSENDARFQGFITFAGRLLALMTTVSKEQIEAELSLVTRSGRETLESMVPPQFVDDEEHGRTEVYEPTGQRMNGANHVTSRMTGTDRMGLYVGGLTAQQWVALQKVERDIIREERARSYNTGRFVEIDPAIIVPAFIGWGETKGKPAKKRTKDKART